MILLKNLNIEPCLQSDVHIIDDKGIPDSIIIDQQHIQWVGSSTHLTAELKENITKEIDFQGRLVTPGLIDCHTHLIFGGNRAEEYQQRLSGISYETIARQGGGILSTVEATRKASEEKLFEDSTKRLMNWLNSGFTGIEIKSGYGLNQQAELKMLRVADKIAKQFPLHVERTLLAAHTLPPEFKGRAKEYINWIIGSLLPEVVSNNLADAVDVFCETIGFNLTQSKKLLLAAREAGLKLKIHAEQLSDSQGTRMATELGALSSDHLEYLSLSGIKSMQNNSTTAVLLPVAYYFLSETQLPPVQALREAGIAIAIASDANPGSSPVLSPLLTMNMATTLFKLTPQEALRGMTINAAKALGLEKQTGSIEVGKLADLAIWDLQYPAELSYWIGGNPCHTRIYQGEVFNLTA